MSQGTWNIDYGPFRGVYRDRDNGWIFGVCAGLAERFNLNVGAVRIIAVVSLLIFFWFTAVVYIAARCSSRKNRWSIPGANPKVNSGAATGVHTGETDG